MSYDVISVTKRGKFEPDWDSCCVRKNQHNRYKFMYVPSRRYLAPPCPEGILAFDHVLLSLMGKIKGHILLWPCPVIHLLLREKFLSKMSLMRILSKKNTKWHAVGGYSFHLESGLLFKLELGVWSSFFSCHVLRVLQIFR